MIGFILSDVVKFSVKEFNLSFASEKDAVLKPFRTNFVLCKL